MKRGKTDNRTSQSSKGRGQSGLARGSDCRSGRRGDRGSAEKKTASSNNDKDVL